MADRFDKFTERARRALTLAQEETLRFNHGYIGTEHLLLGLALEGEGIAAGVLASLGVELENVRAEVRRILSTSPRPTTDRPAVVRSFPDALRRALNAMSTAKDMAIAQQNYEQAAALRDLEAQLSQMIYDAEHRLESEEDSDA